MLRMEAGPPLPVPRSASVDGGGFAVGAQPCCCQETYFSAYMVLAERGF